MAREYIDYEAENSMIVASGSDISGSLGNILPMSSVTKKPNQI